MLPSFLQLSAFCAMDNSGAGGVVVLGCDGWVGAMATEVFGDVDDAIT